MKVIITRQYSDTVLKRNMNIGEVIEVTNERAEILIKKDYAISLEVKTETPKKIRAKRK